MNPQLQLETSVSLSQQWMDELDRKSEGLRKYHYHYHRAGSNQHL